MVAGGISLLACHMNLFSENNYKEIVRVLYRAFLRREADEDGLFHYVNQFKAGRSLESIFEEFMNSKEYKSQINLFVPAGHFYSPIVNPSEALSYLSGREPSNRSLHVPGINIDNPGMVDEFSSFVPYLLEIPFTSEGKMDLRYRFNNDAYSWADGSILYSMLRKYKPRRLIEIGSGWSSACSIDTIEIYFRGKCDVSFIEPYPALLNSLLGNTKQKVAVYDTPVQQVNLSVFSELEEGDFLFIDSTHVAKTGSDVCFEIFEILPVLKPGVRVHFHDVFWPFEYPHNWILEENRSWNEIYMLRAFLQDNNNWKITFFNDYFGRLQKELIASIYPDYLQNTGGAIWLEKLR